MAVDGRWSGYLEVAAMKTRRVEGKVGYWTRDTLTLKGRATSVHPFITLFLSQKQQKCRFYTVSSLLLLRILTSSSHLSIESHVTYWHVNWHFPATDLPRALYDEWRRMLWFKQKVNDRWETKDTRIKVKEKKKKKRSPLNIKNAIRNLLPSFLPLARVLTSNCSKASKARR